MESWSDIFAPLIGRILVGGYFLWSGIELTLNFAGTTEPAWLVSLFIAVEVLGGCALVVGYKTRPAALILAVYSIVVALLYTDFSNPAGQALFLQSMAVIGGLLYISAYGAGLWTTDWVKK